MLNTLNSRISISCFTLMLLMFTSTVFAHTKSISADPAPRSILNRSPQVISIIFSQAFEPSYSTITVKNSDGEQVTEAKATVDTNNKKRLVLSLPTLPAGKYTVSYKVLSLDGHTVSSRYTFRIKKDKPTDN
ncbi:MAG: copper-binding protein [Piscirickettsiaceae bacterium]|nr:MAG: copper-binding protein [Piscirickettsiaceae bacterium]PCH85586.1 MAG: copper-binding protein [Piscirickettsiaceae bacterium]